MSENQELTECRDFHVSDHEIDISLYQNEAEKSIKTLKLIFKIIPCHRIATDGHNYEPHFSDVVLMIFSDFLYGYFSLTDR